MQFKLRYIVMVVSLSSSLNVAKPGPYSALTSHSNRPPKFIAISCKASENETTNFYKVLSLSSNNAGIDEIKRAYRTMALKYHPDVCHPSEKEESARIFVELHEAYKTLLDAVSREEHDHELSMGDFAGTYKIDVGGDQLERKRWKGQIVELRRRSGYRATQQQEGSWGSRMRAQNRENGD
ncbi:unnamed protein product [Camellia sinensis]|uniref:J domain-containing protein n=2 Tax=Camellia sinensis TaxID=4442 RepID=A0A4S4E066_CAMSN|nr:hypothetical protein TEA_027105 [Camellia sinensis var. sinensis]